MRTHATLGSGTARWIASLICASCVFSYGSKRALTQSFPADASVVVDRDHDGIDDNFEQNLADRFAPVIYIEPDESNYPVNVEWFLARGRLEYHEDCGFFQGGDVDEVRIAPIGTQANLLGPGPGFVWAGGPYCGEDDTGYSHPPHRQLTTVATDPDGQVSAGAATTGYSDQQTFVIPDLDDVYHVGSTNPADWKTYFHVYPSADGGIMIQYWHLFAYNELSAFGFGRHGGDWDASIQVQLDSSLAVKAVWFSRHDQDHPGQPFSPDAISFYGNHPLMAIDGGGHAAFASPDDFCGNHSVVGGTIAWPTDVTNPTNPALLGIVKSIPPFCGGIFVGSPGGIVWETWTDGQVLAAGNITHPISAPSGHGGLVNLGEYNPCTPATCNGSAQRSTLLAGKFYPLNGQIFIAYEGVWGSLPHQDVVGQPPRGPVFQGWHDEGEGHISYYNSWYNQGANNPASNDGNHPWLVPPTTDLSFSGPRYIAADGTTSVSGATLLFLTPTQNSSAESFGDSTTYYRTYAMGTAPGEFSFYAGPFFLTRPEGAYVVEYFSVDAIGNIGGRRSVVLTLDATPPSVTIAQPASTVYLHGAVLTLDYSAADGGSGVASMTALLDGVPMVGGHGLADGQSINLLTELSLGYHTLDVTAADNVGNTKSLSVAFAVITTPENIQQDVAQFVASGDITQDDGMSLLSKLKAAAQVATGGNCEAASRIYAAFIHELSAQSGMHVSPNAAAIMAADAQYLIGHCR